MSNSVRVRFAPSPTGALHIGGVRTALYNYLFARKMGGKFLLRIEDTDQARFVPGAEQYIIDSLAWLGISPDEGVGVGGPHEPYRQSERKVLYKAYADQLLAEGKAYYAFDTSEDLDAMRTSFESQGSAFQYNSLTRVKLIFFKLFNLIPPNAQILQSQFSVIKLNLIGPRILLGEYFLL